MRWSLLVVCFGGLALGQSVVDGKEVYGPCAACHGAHGEGGKGGEYPRLAGQPAAFTVESLKQFQSRKRANLPMFPYTEPRELSERDMKDVAAFLERLELPTKMPALPANASALERLVAAERVLVVPRVAGDVARGKSLYLEACADCHGKTGLGRASREAPRLVGQYPEYLQRQLEAFRARQRGADEGHPMYGVLDELSREDLTSVLAFLTAIQEDEPAPDGGVR